MSKLAPVIRTAFWPDVDTEAGSVRARALAAGTLFWLYFLSNFETLFGSATESSQTQSSALYLIALAGLASTIYLAMRIQLNGCQFAAWAAFLWLGYQAIDGFMDSNICDGLILCAASYFSFQGLRSCPISRTSENGQPPDSDQQADF